MIHVIFDMDGVIFDSESALLGCWVDTGARYGFEKEFVRNTYIRCIGTNSNQTARIFQDAFLEKLGEEKLRCFREEIDALYRERYPDGVMPMKAGVKEILTYLKAVGIKAGIASSTKKQIVEWRIRTAGLDEYFIGCIGGDAVKISKPDPEIYLLACKEFGFEPAATFAIEDSYNGIRSAKAAGLMPIMVPDILPADEEMRAISKTVCADLFEAAEYLQNTMGQFTKQS
ncbi:MAG: HAD family phosphatase [Oscillospiraceae bacterium]|nr:HAD family phosphatase [Oscillospiraceae bacterium]